MLGLSSGMSAKPIFEEEECDFEIPLRGERKVEEIDRDYGHHSSPLLLRFLSARSEAALHKRVGGTED